LGEILNYYPFSAKYHREIGIMGHLSSMIIWSQKAARKDTKIILK